MRLLIMTVAIITVASLVGVDRIRPTMVVPTPLHAADRVAEVLAAAKKALGGEDKLAAVKGLSAEGPFRRSMGARDMEGTVSLLIVRPDKFKRVEEMQIGGMVGGPSIERTSTLAGTKAWDDTQNRGAMGGGIQMVIRDGPPPPPPPPPGGGPAPAQPAPPTQEQLDEARVRRMKIQLSRYLSALFVEGPQTWVDAGTAESPEGKADILEAKEENGRMIRLFIDQATHLPLMVQYQDPKPMVMMQGGPGGAVRMTPEEMQKRAEEMRRQPPQMGTYALHLTEYKKVDGVMLPHKIETSLDGEPNEEWTIEKYKVNPSIKADTWEKK